MMKTAGKGAKNKNTDGITAKNKNTDGKRYDEVVKQSEGFVCINLAVCHKL